MRRDHTGHRTRAISTDPALTQTFLVEGKAPRSVIVVAVDTVFYQCAKAMVRSKLWDAARHVERKSLPSAGTILADLTKGELGGPEHDRSRRAIEGDDLLIDHRGLIPGFPVTSSSAISTSPMSWVIHDWSLPDEIYSMSAMLRLRRPAARMRPVAMGQQLTFITSAPRNRVVRCAGPHSAH